MAYKRINKARYLQAWKLRQAGLTFNKIGDIMRISKSRARQMYIIHDFLFKRRKLEN